MNYIDESMNGYEKNYLLLAQRLKDIDLAKVAPALGYGPQGPGPVKVNFFNREYLVDNQGVEAADGGPQDPSDRGLITGYFYYQGQGEPAGVYVTLGSLNGPPEGPYSVARATYLKKLNKFFGEDLASLNQAAAKLGGQPLGQEKSGQWAWLFYPFPKVPLKLVYSEADEEYPAENLILFDQTAKTFLDIEFLVVLAVSLSRQLIEQAGGNPKDL